MTAFFELAVTRPRWPANEGDRDDAGRLTGPILHVAGVIMMLTGVHWLLVPARRGTPEAGPATPPGQPRWWVLL
jgi:hypothetical protein